MRAEEAAARAALEWADGVVRRETVGRTLDIGCGSGRSLAGGIVGVDIDPEALAAARARSGLLVRADAHALPFRDASFDTAYAHRMLNEAGHIDDVLRGIRRVLRPGGRLLVLTRARAAGGDRLDRWSGEARLRPHFERVRVVRHPTDERAAVFVAERPRRDRV